MDRETVNTYLDGFLSLAEESPASATTQTGSGAQWRHLLIEESLEANSLTSLIYEWLLLLDKLRTTEALKLKIWFGLSYSQISEIFSVSLREISQLIRNERAQLLGNRILPQLDQGEAAKGFSCFMVEQWLSSWIDGEIEDRRSEEAVKEHLHGCADCQTRLQDFRALQKKILLARAGFPSVSEDEWQQVRASVLRSQRNQYVRLFSFFLILIFISSILIWVIWSKPAKIPNIYEIPD